MKLTLALFTVVTALHVAVVSTTDKAPAGEYSMYRQLQRDYNKCTSGKYELPHGATCETVKKVMLSYANR